MQDLDRLLRPQSIAVIGGGMWCRSVIEQCQKFGFSGKLWPVHPKAEEIGGLRAYRSVNELPDAPDAAFIGVNRHATVDVVKNLANVGSGGAVCFASGFLEAQAEDEGGAKLQQELLTAAGDMPIIGPNCYGFINYLDGAALWPDQHGGRRVERGVAIITQSSNMAINISMQNRALPIAYIATAGNQAQQGLADIGRALLCDDRVSALGLHIEGLGNIAAFEALSKAAKEMGKGIVAIKVGQSEQAQAATISHTASLAGSDAGARAVLNRLGIARLKSVPEFLETLKLLHFCGPLKGNKIASLSCSGGEASLIADTALSYNVRFPALNEIQRVGLREALGPMVALANPLDYHTYIWGNGRAIGAMMTAMMTGDQDITLSIVDFPRDDRCSPAAWECVLEGAEIAVKEGSGPLAFVTTLPENISEPVADRLMAMNVLPMHGFNETLAAIEAAHFIALSQEDTWPPIVIGKSSRNPVMIDEADAKSELSAFGLDVPHRAIASSLEDVLKEGTRIGFPLVLKGRGIAHKTESGAVRLDISNSEELERAVREMGVKEFLVEEMIEEAVCELLIGITRDAAHGFVLTLAAGGVLTELLSDQVSLVLPVQVKDVNKALGQLKLSKLLAGYRGKPAAELSQIAKAVMALQEYVLAHINEVEEVEINPLIVTPARSIAVDALIRKGEADV